VPDDPVETLRAQHEAEGVYLHARTACPGWLGERLDVVWAIDVLHPLARQDRRVSDLRVPREMLRASGA
jgi:hypothetical protein